VAPGVIYSDSAAANYGDPSYLTANAPNMPAKRLGTTEEVAAAVLFLLSPAASYISGDTLRVDAGSSLYAPPWVIPPEPANWPKPFAGRAGPRPKL
jgi:peroxisomal trans-2-enoyl-CoA reductase